MKRQPSTSPLAVKDRRLAIISLLAKGESPAAIARRLTLHVRTVQEHIAAAKDELNAGSHYEIAEKAVGRHIIAREDQRLSKVTLTDQELSILSHIARDRSPTDIAQRLRLTVQAVNMSTKLLKDKLHVRSRFDAIDAAIALGLAPETWRRTLIPNPLTEIDVEIIAYLDLGLTHLDIDDARGTKPRTSRGLIERVRAKLRARDIDEIPKVARRFGLIDARCKRIPKIKSDIQERLWRRNPEPAMTPLYERVLTAMHATTETKALGARLGTAEKTVNQYCHRLAREFGVTTRDDTVRRAVELGYLADDGRALRERLELGRREWQLAKLLVLGKSRASAAARMGASISSIDTTLSSIRYKLGTTSRKATIEALKKAISEG